jgi:hypothetical protein
MDFQPVVYEHAARLIGRSPWAVSRDRELLIAAHAAAFELYRHAPIMVGIDIYNLEAEAYGAVVTEPPGNEVPTIPVPPFAEFADVLRRPPLDPARAGRVPLVLSAAQELKRKYPEADVRIPVAGPFSILSNLVGFETVLCGCLTDPDEVARTLLHLATGQFRFCEAALRCGLGISLFESAASPPLLAPETFAAVVLPALRRLAADASRLAGRPVACILGGNTFPILDCLLETRPGFLICPFETDQAEFMRRLAAFPDILVRVNMRPAVFVSADLDAACAEADRVLALVGNRAKACIGPGGLAYDAFPETVLAVKRYIETEQR